MACVFPAANVFHNLTYAMYRNPAGVWTDYQMCVLAYYNRRPVTIAYEKPIDWPTYAYPIRFRLFLYISFLATGSYSQSVVYSKVGVCTSLFLVKERNLECLLRSKKIPPHHDMISRRRKRATYIHLFTLLCGKRTSYENARTCMGAHVFEGEATATPREALYFVSFS